VLGLGFAATRDVVSYLRHSSAQDNPLYGGIQFAITHGESESGRYLKGFTYWGFNEDEDGRIVFEGILPKISGAHAIASNDRFGDANATGRSYQRHLSAKQEFPFTYEVRFDPVSGLTDGIFVRCQATNTCPKVMHTDSGNEPYLKPTALVTTDGLGHDIALPNSVRVYMIGSTQHAPQANVTTAPSGVCQQPGNPNQHSPIVRALIVALDRWATQGVDPPASRYARVSDGTLVASLPQALQGFPVIPGVVYTGWYERRVCVVQLAEPIMVTD
jgi:Alpha/beta hydrolase domain